jgi:beta-N-acetylhexosaminidase
MLGWEGQDSGEIRSLIDEFSPGGLIFFRRNYPCPRPPCSRPPGSRTAGSSGLMAPAALQDTLRTIQRYARRVLGRTLLIAADQEGGLVRRFPEPYSQIPSARNLGRMHPEDIELAARRTARELYESGLNFNLAPVLDLDSGPLGYIGSRSFSADPQKAAECALAFMHGLAAGGVLSCGKHFPGLGASTVDPHRQTTEIEMPLSELKKAISIFRALIEAGLPAVMTTHIYYPALDPARMATFSPAVVRYLREEVGFDGLLLTDDLEMGAVSGQIEPGLAAVQAVLAGHDLVLICRRADFIRKVYGALLEAIKNSQITKGHLLESGLRLKAFLNKLPY